VTSRPALRQGYARTLAGRDTDSPVSRSWNGHFDEEKSRESRFNAASKLSISRWENVDCQNARTESAVRIDRREREASRESSRLYVHSTTPKVPGRLLRDVSSKAIA